MACVRSGGADELPSKRLKLPRKFSDGCNINHAPVPRKLRSAIKKRINDSRKTKMNLGSITEDEQEVAEALYALAAMLPDEASKQPSNVEETIKFQSSTDDDQLHRFVTIDLNADTNAIETSPAEKNGQFSGVSKNSWKRCCTHVYVSQLVKVLQSAESTQTENGSKQKPENQPMAFQLPQSGYSTTSLGHHSSTASAQQVLSGPYAGNAVQQLHCQELQNWHISEWQNGGQNGHSLQPVFRSSHSSSMDIVARGQYYPLPDGGFEGNGLPALYPNGVPVLQMLCNGHR